MAKKIFFVLLILIFFAKANSQTIINFEDGSLSGWTQSTPGHWQASTDRPINGNFSLHHTYDSPTSGHDQITFSQNIDASEGHTTWKFKIKYGYSPSSTNNWAIYLMVDTPAQYITQDNKFNGYAIGVDLYTQTDDTLKFYRIDSGQVETILKTSINWQNDIGTSPVGLVINRSSNGKWEIFISKTASYQRLTFLGSVVDQTYQNAKYFGIYYEYSAAQDRKLWFDDLEIYHSLEPNSSISLQVNNDSINAITSSDPGVNLLQITLSDDPTDDLPTKINSLILTQNSNNQINNWNNIIQGCKLTINDIDYYGTVSDNAITFPLNLNIENSQSVDAQLYLWLNAHNNDTIDNKSFVFDLNSINIITSDNGASFIDTNLSTNPIKIFVQASNIKFSKVPLTVLPNIDFSIELKAVDLNGNTDLDNTSQITLSLNSGTGVLNSVSGLTKHFINGQIQWTDLTYSDLGYFSILANTGDLGYKISPRILSNTYLYFLKDDFEDGDISDWIQQYPGHWIASDENPIQGNYSLKEVYDNSESATEWIVHPVYYANLDTLLTWEFSIKYDISSPSSSNNWNFLLMSDANPINSDSYNGYAIGINWVGYDDLITLWKIIDGQPQVLLKTSFNWQDSISSGEIVDVKITRNSQGNWNIYLDTVPQFFDNLFNIGSVTDSSFTQANYLGIRYKYTSSNDRKLSIDNIYFGQNIPDTIPPHLDTAIAVSPKTIKVYFNEIIDTSALSTANFQITDNQVINVTPSATNQKLITITLQDSLLENTEYLLKVTNINDLAGNTMDLDSCFIIWENLKITSFYFPDYNKIKINFNKHINVDSASDITGYRLSPNTANIINVDAATNSIQITFDDSLISKQDYLLYLNKIYDNYGNKLGDSILYFKFYIAKTYDVVINEIMFDVNPAPPALPAHKYIEIFNRTDVDINLTNWKLQVGTSPLINFPNITLQAHGYALICSNDATGDFENFGTLIPVLNESYLTTTGKTIKIFNAQNLVIDQISYTTEFYNSDTHNTGGWSVERIDPNNLCYQNNNWHVSTNPIGGTPDFINSVFGQNQDTTKPVVTQLDIISSRELKLNFNKPISPESASNQLNFIINNSYTAFRIQIDEQNANAIDLIFANDFNNGENTLLVRNLQDYCNNTMDDTIIVFNYQKIHLQAIEPITQNELKLFFSENVDKTSAQNPGNYTLLETNSHPIVALRSDITPSQVFLIFDQDFNTDSIYHLIIDSISDLNNNLINPDTQSFTYHKPQPGDIVFNEFMIDISPQPAGLPAHKYIELYNNTKFTIWLKNWTLTSPSQRIYDLPEFPVKPNSFILLTSEQGANAFNGTCLGIISETEITDGLYILKDDENNIIDAVNIYKTWFDDNDKQKGGWSLEKQNPKILCQSNDLWTASENLKGGTPNQTNSTFTTSGDFPHTKISGTQVVNAKQILVTFSQLITKKTAWDTNNYILNSQKPSKIQSTDFQHFLLTFVNQLQNNSNNHLTINNIKDNCNQTIELYDTSFVYKRIHLKDLLILDSNLIKITLSEKPSENSVYNKNNYTLNQDQHPSFILLNSTDSTEIFLEFNQAFNNGLNRLQISNLTDIFNNPIQTTDTQFIYFIPDSGQIVINEILFNPYPDCARYIELYNKTDYPVQLQNLSLCNLTNGIFDNIVQLTTNPELTIKPHDYLTITTDTQNVKTTYPEHGIWFLQSKLPKMYNDSGNLVLLTKNNKLIDYVQYSEKMHNKLISDPEGVALERINSDLPSLDKNNWTSAAATVSYGTPSLKNSQYFNPDSIKGNDLVNLSSNVISPDGDDYQDIMHITVKAPKPGTFCSILITTKNGIILKKLTTNQSISEKQTFLWDGTDYYGQKLKRGFYVIIVKLYTTDGFRKTIRKTIAVAQKN